MFALATWYVSDAVLARVGDVNVLESRRFSASAVSVLNKHIRASKHKVRI